MARSVLRLACLGVAVVVLAACGTPQKHRPIGAGVQRVEKTSPNRGARRAAPSHYRVVKGDTLYSISWRHGLDYRRVAKWNGISSPYLIHPGDLIRLRPPDARVPAEPVRAAPQAAKAPAAQLPRRAVERRRYEPTASLAWRWPTRGKVLQARTGVGKNGIAIKGKLGQPILAAEAGEVVYSGSGLSGYGKLIIIKHNDTFLSAYAYNRRLLVAEGSLVEAGQQIAEMGRSTKSEPMLHFEIRRNGKPVSPQQFLPKQQL